jgi:hypothetical protein
MRRGLRSREKAACIENIRAAIGRQLKAEYQFKLPVPDRIADLVKKYASLLATSLPEDSRRCLRFAEPNGRCDAEERVP